MATQGGGRGSLRSVGCALNRQATSLTSVIAAPSRLVFSTLNLFAADASRRGFSVVCEKSRGLELAYNNS
jgi:hypothetical protein